MLKIPAHLALKKTSLFLLALSIYLPVTAHAGSELASVFEAPLREKKATKSPDGVTVSASAESPVDGPILLPSGWKRIELVFGPRSGSSSNIRNAVTVALGFFVSEAETEKPDAIPLCSASVEMRQLHSRMKSGQPNTKFVIFGPGGQEKNSHDILVEGADQWFPIYAGRKEAIPFRLVVERASQDAKSGKVILTDPSGAEAVSEEIEFSSIPAAARIRVSATQGEGQSLSANFSSLTVE
jgi:hypothetical protein